MAGDNGDVTLADGRTVGRNPESGMWECGTPGERNLAGIRALICESRTMPNRMFVCNQVDVIGAMIPE